LQHCFNNIVKEQSKNIMLPIKSIKNIDPTGKRVIVRVDFNVPLNEEGLISDDTRIVAVIPTIRYLLERRSKIILISHLGRPKGQKVLKYSLKPVAATLAQKIGEPVVFVKDCVGEKVQAAVDQMTEGSIILLENLRFYPEEEKNDSDFAKKLAQLGDIYVNDAFGAAHRAHASTHAITTHIPVKVAGLLMSNELAYLGDKTNNPDSPFVVILGGAKVSDKIKVIESLLDKADTIVIGGAMAYTFLMAQGKNIGDSLSEPDQVEVAQATLNKAKEKGVQFILPVDHVIVDTIDFNTHTIGNKKDAHESIEQGWQGVDIGPETIKLFSDQIDKARTIFWNGPMGIFEIQACSKGTFAIAKAVASRSNYATSIVGGGDSITAIKQSGYEDDITFMSTGGGASLEYIEKKEKLPGIAVLDKTKHN
jgi:phosphoglycerate kinase